ncbi:MAG: outer membrane beta-barrel protein [Proteobacteria bacterium]|nr:outer membrane beta-barrel protein [Pseudomonadota bacterium]
MKYIVLGFALVFNLFYLPAHADGSSNNINLMLGQKQLESDDWESPYDEQGEFGILCDFRGENWPVSLALEFLGSAKDDTEDGLTVTGSTTEICIGLKKIWETDNTRVRPFVGFGLASITAKIEGEYEGITASTEETGVGFYISGGVLFTLTEHFNLGFIARFSKANVTFENQYVESDIEAGGSHAGILVGFHW